MITGGIRAAAQVGGAFGGGLAALGGAAVPPSAPTANMVYRVRADLGITLNGGDVSAWADQSGTGDANKNATQSTAGLQPLFVASNADFNNQPSVRFTAASGDYMITGTWAAALAQPATWYLVYKGGTTAGHRAVIDGIAAGNRHTVQNLTGTGVPFLFAGASVDAATNKASARTYLAAVVNGASSAIYVDNFTTAEGSGNAGAHSLTGLTIGSNYLFGNGLDGDVAELLAYSVAHDATARAEVLAYLQGRYG